jgi:CheY-like chemotaxis protein
MAAGYNGVTDMDIQRHPSHSHRLRILLVEDHDDTAKTTALLLQQDGYEVHVVADGPAALQATEAVEPDVVLLDVGLPGMDGYELAKCLRERMTAKRPFLVAITGYGTEEDRRRSEEAGIDLHLLKPVEFTELSRLLARFQAIVTPGGLRLAAPSDQDTGPLLSKEPLLCRATR